MGMEESGGTEATALRGKGLLCGTQILEYKTLVPPLMMESRDSTCQVTRESPDTEQATQVQDELKCSWRNIQTKDGCGFSSPKRADAVPYGQDLFLPRQH
ncbi:hypothetical protein BTVI_28895 [Pitangus sulphuratus]|nr:hypothetical protein BTVI_28895 [Pitangus sulphuratus]